jgi:CheY-like chemotaxis protein
MPKIRVLWIDDGAITELAELTGPVYAAGEYDLVVVTNVSDAIDQILSREFDVIIVDIRLPPGENKEWRHLYSGEGQSRTQARLGLELLAACLGRSQKIRIDPLPSWIKPHLFAVFTVEEKTAVQSELSAVDVKIHLQKTASSKRDVLVGLINTVRSQQMGNPGR